MENKCRIQTATVVYKRTAGGWFDNYVGNVPENDIYLL